MAITTGDALVNALGNNSTRILWEKASIANTASGQLHSLWRATGQPGQGAIPAAAAVCDNTTAGAFQFAQQTSPNTSYFAWGVANCSNNAVTLELHDRLMHMGGLSGTLTTAQTANVDLSANLGTANLAARIGDANYSDVSWWLEWYTDTGATVVNATVSVTYDNGTTGTLTPISLAATRRASLMIPLNGFIPAAVAGRFIRDVDSVQLSASTAAAGSFGVTATRHRASIDLPLANKAETRDWAQLGLPEIHNSSCLFLVQLASTTTTGTVRGQGKIAHG